MIWVLASSAARSDGVAHAPGDAAGDRLPFVGRVVGVHRVDAHIVDGDAQPLGGELGGHGQRALAHVHPADVDQTGAVLVEADGGRRAGVGRHGRRLPHGRHPLAAALARPAGLARLVPLDGLSRLGDALAQAGGVHDHAGDRLLAILEAVQQAHLHRVEPQLRGGAVDVLLDGPVDLRHAEAAHRAADGVVGVDTEGVGVDVGHEVGAGGAVAGGAGDVDAVLGVRAGVPVVGVLHRGDAAIVRSCPS